MAFTYPVTLNLNNRRCTVVGGGEVALRKVQSLLAEQANVVVVSPVLCEELQELYQTNAFTWIDKAFEEKFLQDSFLVIAATNNRAINHQVSMWCERNRVLVNVVDSREESSFTVNSVVRRGDLLIAISTGGASPAVSKAIRVRLEETFGEEYAVMLEIMADTREKAMDTIADEKKRRAFLQQLAQMNLHEVLKTESKEEVQKRVELCLSSYWA